MKKFEYNFPPCNQYEGTLQQVVKIIEEAHEVLDAYVNGGDMYDEVMDVIHACETLLRECNDAFVQRTYESTVAKNRERGYYGE